MLNLSRYNHVILDFDGVVIDSNFIKEKAISKVANNFLDKILAVEFIEYFTKNNGIPREIKIDKFFANIDISQNVLNQYNEILKTELIKACFTKNFELFLKKLHFYEFYPYILSGGDRIEIKNILENKNMISDFSEILGGPLTKYENLDNLNLKGNILYIGDSKIDYEVAKKYNYDFIFMYGYSQFQNWREFFKNKKEVIIIKDFETLTNSYC